MAFDPNSNIAWCQTCTGLVTWHGRFDQEQYDEGRLVIKCVNGGHHVEPWPEMEALVRLTGEKSEQVEQLFAERVMSTRRARWQCP